jgi:hypothetical protein
VNNLYLNKRAIHIVEMKKNEAYFSLNIKFAIISCPLVIAFGIKIKNILT